MQGRQEDGIMALDDENKALSRAGSSYSNWHSVCRIKHTTANFHALGNASTW